MVCRWCVGGVCRWCVGDVSVVWCLTKQEKSTQHETPLAKPIKRDTVPCYTNTLINVNTTT